MSTRQFSETWQSRDITTGGMYFTVSGFDAPGDCILAARTFLRGPEIATIRRGQYRAVKSFDLGYGAALHDAGVGVEALTWTAPDGLAIQGWLLRPKGSGPYPVVLNVHGGPVWQWHPVGVSAPLLMLLQRGYAVFLPNPRGSTGRGQAFIRRVIGDMGGADAQDCLSGIDSLIAKGIADPRRLAVTGVSYGGFMSAWLIGHHQRFAAAVVVAPMINYVTQHLLSNIPNFVSLYLKDRYTNLNGEYFRRSPIMYADRVSTPTLIVCGALDRSAPPEEALQFHNALLENGATSVLVTYPEEGHGVRNLPAAIDYAARVVDWLEEHMSGNGNVGRLSPSSQR